jgi:hypothetical protein
MRLPKTKVEYLAIAFSALVFWYAKYSYELEMIGLRGSRFYRSEEPLLFWLGLIFVAGFGFYLLFLVFISDEKAPTHNKRLNSDNE